MDSVADGLSGTGSAAVWPPAPRVEGYSGDPVDAGLPPLPSIALAIETLPYAHSGARLSPFRSGEAILSERRLRLSGRIGPSRRHRARLYFLGGLGFLPGVAVAYLMLERLPWGRQTIDIVGDDVVAVSCRSDYRLVTVVYRAAPADSTAGPVQSVTFQVEGRRYAELVDMLEQHFPGKLTVRRLRPALEPGAEAAWFGIALWTLGIAAAYLSQM